MSDNVVLDKTVFVLRKQHHEYVHSLSPHFRPQHVPVVLILHDRQQPCWDTAVLYVLNRYFPNTPYRDPTQCTNHIIRQTSWTKSTHPYHILCSRLTFRDSIPDIWPYYISDNTFRDPIPPHMIILCALMLWRSAKHCYRDGLTKTVWLDTPLWWRLVSGICDKSISCMTGRIKCHWHCRWGRWSINCSICSLRMRVKGGRGRIRSYGSVIIVAS